MSEIEIFRVFQDGDQMCAVMYDFTNLQESPCGFGDGSEDALDALERELAEGCRCTSMDDGSCEACQKYCDLVNARADNCELCNGTKGGVRGNENHWPADNEKGYYVVCDYCTAMLMDIHPSSIKAKVQADLLEACKMLRDWCADDATRKLKMPQAVIYALGYVQEATIAAIAEAE